MRTDKTPITTELVGRMKLALHYDDEVGDFTWVAPSKFHNELIGCIAGKTTRSGYRLIQFEGRKYSAHRMAWAFTHGEIMPDVEIDHINNNRSDNRISNLRVATYSDNGCNQVIGTNNTSGVKGVSWHNPSGKWRARVAKNGVTYYIGHFSNIDDAEKAICAEREKIHGEYVNHG